MNNSAEGIVIFILLEIEIENAEPLESSEDLKNDNLHKEIQKIKDLRNKKRQVQHTDETYDQDFVEIKNIKTDVLLNGILFQ